MLSINYFLPILVFFLLNETFFLVNVEQTMLKCNHHLGFVKAKRKRIRVQINCTFLTEIKLTEKLK